MFADGGQPGALSERQSISVLRFTNISGDPDDDWLSVGIADTVMTDLQQVDTLSIIIVEPNQTMRDVAAGGGLASIVQGGFQRIGDRLRITAQITDVETGVIRGTARADGDFVELFQLQDQIVDALIQSFEQLAALPRPPAAPVAQPVALPPAAPVAEPAAPSPLAPRTATLPSPGGRPAGAGTALPTAESRPSRIPGVGAGDRRRGGRTDLTGRLQRAALCANIVETPSYPFISEQGGKDDSLCW